MKKNQMSNYLIWAYYANIMLLVSKLVTKFKLQRPRSHIMKKIQQFFFTKSDSELCKQSAQNYKMGKQWYYQIQHNKLKTKNEVTNSRSKMRKSNGHIILSKC